MMRRILLFIATTAVIGALLAVWAMRSPARTPRGQPPLATLHSSRDFAARFDAHPNEPRFLALVSSDSSDDLAALDKLASFLAGYASLEAHVFIVWQPGGFRSRFGPPRAALSHVEDRRVEQLWDPDDVVGRDLSSRVKRTGSVHDLFVAYGPKVVWAGPDLPPATAHGKPAMAGVEAVIRLFASSHR